MPSGLPPPCGGISFTRRTKVFPNPCRKAHRNYFTLPYSLFSSYSLRPEESHAPAFPPHFPGTPENCSPQGRSHFLGTVPVPAACV